MGLFFFAFILMVHKGCDCLIVCYDGSLELRDMMNDTTGTKPRGASRELLWRPEMNFHQINFFLHSPCKVWNYNLEFDALISSPTLVTW